MAFQIPANLDRYLAALSKVYGKEGKRTKQEILVNARIRIQEAYERWASGVGHALYLHLPEYLFLAINRHKEEIQDQLRTDLNEMHHIPDEHIANFFLEMEIPHDHDWRKESGLLRDGKRLVMEDAQRRIWGADGFRLFLSHKSEVKKETAVLKEKLQTFGVSCFLAHEDIHPTHEWQDEIENALASMDGFAALLTQGFHDSAWTDQEVGYALARGVPMIAVRLEKDPYGFIGKFQGLATTWDACAEQLVRLLLKHERMLNAYVQALRRCTNFENGNTLAKVLPGIERLSPQQIDDLVASYNESTQLQGSYGFNGKWFAKFGHGLVPHLNRLGTRRFKYGTDGLIEVTK
jgi:TIR domain-containing protein